MSSSDNQRVRAVLLTAQARILLLKRIRPGVPEPYWVTPGGGIDPDDDSPAAALHREMAEELGGTVRVIRPLFSMAEVINSEHVTQHYYLCHLLTYDITRRSGPELTDPTRGAHILEFYPLQAAALAGLNIKRPAFRTWLLDHLPALRDEAARL